MRENQFNRLLNLIRRTGDRLVVLDKDSDTSLVMMDIGEYEKMLDGGTKLEEMSDSDILDKINREVAIWREKNMANEVSEAMEDDLEHLEPESSVHTTPKEVSEEPQYIENLANVSQNTPESLIDGPVTVNPIPGPEVELKDVPDGGEEEKFYLEPV